jgi:hypothetical protein
MTTTDELARRFRKTLDRAQFADWTRMYTGRRTATGLTLSGADAGRVWVRADENSREETQVWGSASRINIPVWVGPNVAGELEIKALEETEAALVAGDGAAASILPPINPDNNINLLIGGRQFQPGRMGLSNMGGLYVRVDPFHYSGGWWQGGDVLLTPPSTASTQAWCALAFDPIAETFTQYTGAHTALPILMTETELGGLAITPGQIPVGAVVLYNGQTVIDGSEVWADFHLHFGAVEGKATVQTPGNTATTIASVAVAEDEAVTVTGVVTGAIADYSASIGGTLMIAARRAAGGNVTLVGAATVDVQEDSANAPVFTADVDAGTQTVRLRVTGVAAETWNWRAAYTVLRS